MRILPLVAVLVSGAALADDDTDTSGQGTPAPSIVQGRLAGSSAKLAARFTIEVPAMGVFEQHATISVPERAVVSGARVTVEGVTHELSLVDAARARELWDQTIARGPGADRAWQFVLSGEPGHEVTLDITAPKQARVELQLEVELPTCFYRDVRYVALPEVWQVALDPALARLRVPHSEELAQACHATPDAWIAFPARELAAQPAGAARIGTLGDRLPLPTTHLARVELDIARELGEVPRDLHTVLLVDSSRSMREDERATQRDVIAAYMQAARGTDVQVIAYARKAWPLLAGWTSTYEAAHVDRELAALPVRNGSNLDAGLAEAGAWLAQTHGTRRVIVFTDELVRDQLAARPPQDLARVLPPDTLVHVVAVSGAGGSSIARDDDRPFAPLATATFGMSVVAQSNGEDELDATLLARPVSLDKLAIETPGWTTIEWQTNVCGDALGEGENCTWLGRGDMHAGAVTVRGKIWGRDFVRTIAPDPAQARTLARALAPVAMELGLANEVRLDVERAARVVGEVWSLYAGWGRDGYSDLELGGWGCGCGTGSIGGFGRSGIGDRFGTAIPQDDLHAQLQHAIDACHAEGAHVRFDLELTLDEIVDVGVVSDRAATHDCLVEAAWDTMLVVRAAPPHQRVVVSFGA